jgi:hypothetical protein
MENIEEDKIITNTNESNQIKIQYENSK